jgi:hypothetical protein
MRGFSVVIKKETETAVIERESRIKSGISTDEIQDLAVFE